MTTEPTTTESTPTKPTKPLTRAQLRAERRARRNTPQATFQRHRARSRNAALAAERMAAMRANPHDLAWKVTQ